MSAAPLLNQKHETYALLICAGFEPSEAHVRAGYRADTKGGNAQKLMARPDIAARISWLKGEHADKPAPVEPGADPDSLKRHLISIAYGATTPPATQIRAIEMLAELNQGAEAWPGDKDFSIDRLSERQRALCQLYVSQPATLSPAESIMSKLAAIRARSENHETLSDPSQSSMSEHRSQPALVWEERTTTSTSTRLTSAVSGHGAR